MFKFSDCLLLVFTLLFAFLFRNLSYRWITNLIRTGRKFAIPACVVIVFSGCALVAGILHEPVPRVHDEFSYLLMADTLAHGRVANPPPPLPEFFDTFHVLVRPVYVSKYWPGQGVFLALGEKATGHPVVGVWLSSALACAATIWMLDAWIGSGWAVVGGFLMALQYGVFSYWSQSYWGGMVAALGGALFFGGIRRLWDRFSVQVSLLSALGLILLASSRPFEGVIAATPVSLLFLHRVCRNRRWTEPDFWTRVALPSSLVLMCGAFLLGAYNHAITGSALRSPYVLHEQQYQESPPFIFLPMRSPKKYSSPWVAYFYHVVETGLYANQRTLLGVARAASPKIEIWWEFFCGALLSVPLLLPGILKRSGRWWRLLLLVALLIIALTTNQRIPGWRPLFDVVALSQIAVLWSVFDGLWQKLAIATCALLILEMFCLKGAFPHYFAPAASLLLYLGVDGLRRIWQWRGEERSGNGARVEGSASEITASPLLPSTLQHLVLFLPLACAVSLGMRITQRAHGWKCDAHGPDCHILLPHDWSLRRADFQRWLEQQPGPQMVIVRYSPKHIVSEEWVYNAADLAHAKVIWARDLGSEHNRLLLEQFPERTPWLVEADQLESHPIPYSQASEGQN